MNTGIFPTPPFSANHSHPSPPTRVPCALKTLLTEVLFHLESGLAMLMSSIIIPKRVGPPPVRQTTQAPVPASWQKELTPRGPDSNSFNRLLCPGARRPVSAGPRHLACLKPGHLASLKPGHAPPCALLLSHFRPHQASGPPTPRLTGSTSPLCLGASCMGLGLQWPALSSNQLRTVRESTPLGGALCGSPGP